VKGGYGEGGGAGEGELNNLLNTVPTVPVGVIVCLSFNGFPLVVS
jgi:hypothetical protein